jgi:hypothetical protein
MEEILQEINTGNNTDCEVQPLACEAEVPRTTKHGENCLWRLVWDWGRCKKVEKPLIPGSLPQIKRYKGRKRQMIQNFGW